MGLWKKWMAAHKEATSISAIPGGVRLQTTTGWLEFAALRHDPDVVTSAQARDFLRRHDFPII